MKTEKIKIKCMVCGKFETEHEIVTNEHGYFSIPHAYCPECLCVLNQVIDHHKKVE